LKHYRGSTNEGPKKNAPANEGWEEVTRETLFNLLKYADERSCSWVLLGSERGVNQDLPTFTHAG
jgi:hypothetical protein